MQTAVKISKCHLTKVLWVSHAIRDSMHFTSQIIIPSFFYHDKVLKDIDRIVQTSHCS